MPIVQAGKQFTASDLKATAGNIAALLAAATQDGGDFAGQLQSWVDADLVTLGLSEEEVNAMKGFFIGDLPAIAAALKASAWLRQLIGTGA